eukprot:7347011-Lingulodinium_polyedra.AAC.1
MPDLRRALGATRRFRQSGIDGLPAEASAWFAPQLARHLWTVGVKAMTTLTPPLAWQGVACAHFPKPKQQPAVSSLRETGLLSR